MLSNISSSPIILPPFCHASNNHKQIPPKKEGINISINSGFRPAYGPNLKAKTKKGKTVNITTQESLRRDKGRWSKSARAGFTTDDDFVFKARSSAYNPATAPPGKSTLCL